MSSYQADTSSLLSAVTNFRDQRVLILGDVILDHYQIGAVERISPEAPVPVVTVQSEEFKLGGACNVAKNIRSLGGIPTLVGVIGLDSRGKQLTRLLEAEEIQTLLVQEPKRKTTIKTRIIAHNQQVVRVDDESSQQITTSTIDKMLQALVPLLENHKVIILSDYGKGIVCKEFMSRLNEILDNLPQRPLLLIDPKVKNFDLYKGATLLTPNAHEAGQGASMAVKDKADILKAGIRIFKRLKCSHLLITLGPDGMACFEGPDKVWKIPTIAQKVYDVTGAGDTVIATVGLCLGSGCDLMTSSYIANYAAGIVVGQVGTASVTEQELLHSLENLPSFPANLWLGK